MLAHNNMTLTSLTTAELHKNKHAPLDSSSQIDVKSELSSTAITLSVFTNTISIASENNHQFEDKHTESKELHNSSLLNKVSEEKNITLPPLGHGDISLLWWPKTKAYAFTHVKLSVDGEVWSCDEGYRYHNTLANTENRAKTNNKGRGYFRFDFKASQSEIISLKGFFYEMRNKEISQTCIGGAAKALRKNTSIRVMNFVPTVVAASLALGKKTGLWAKKVKKIEYIGKGSALKNLASPKVAFDVGFALVACTAVAQGLHLGIAAVI